MRKILKALGCLQDKNNPERGEKMKCYKCLAKLPRKANYCPNCGKSVTGDEECIEETLKLKNPETRNDYEMLSRFAKIQRNEFLKESKQRKHQVSLDPDSLMAREIVYQTALIHQILNEVRNVNAK